MTESDRKRGLPSVAALALATVMGCAASGSGGKAATGGPLPGQWILVESPPKGELSEATFPPIYTWKRVRTFADAESCSNFRVDMMWDAQSTGVTRQSGAGIQSALRSGCQARAAAD